VLQGLFIYAPFMQEVFASRALSADSWLVVLALCAGMFLAVEVEKWLWRRAGVHRL
jgi:hypothetical protein